MPPSIEMYADQSTPLKHLTNQSIISTSFNPLSNQFFSLSSSGHLSATWTKTGSVKKSFANNSILDTRSSNCTTSLHYVDSFGESSMLTGGGFELPSSPSKDSGDSGNPYQGIVKHWNQNGDIVATYMGGQGLVRCLGVPGTRMSSTSSILPDSENDAAGEPRPEDDPDYDPTFNVVEEKLEDKPIVKNVNRNKKQLSFFVAGGDDTVVRLWDVGTSKLMKVSFLAQCLAQPRFFFFVVETIVETNRIIHFAFASPVSGLRNPRGRL